MTFETLAAVSQLALKIDNKINGADTGQPAPATPANPTAMDISAVNARLLDANKSRMLKQGLCFRCGKHSHIARECPLKGTRKGTECQGKGKRKSRFKIDALEEEVKRLTKRLAGEGGGGRADASKNGGAQA